MGLREKAKKKKVKKVKKVKKKPQPLENPVLLELSKKMFEGGVKDREMARFLNKAGKLLRENKIDNEQYKKALELFHKAKEMKENN